MIEQSVIYRGKNKRPGRRLFLRGTQIFAGIALIILEGFVLTVSEVYYYSDKDYFWRLLASMAVLAVPVIGYIVAAQLLHNKWTTTFEYSFDDGELRIEKVVNGSSKRLLMMMETATVSCFGRVTSPAYSRMLRRLGTTPVICACNGDNVNTFFLIAKFRAKKGDARKQMVIIEPKRVLFDALISEISKDAVDPDCKWIQ